VTELEEIAVFQDLAIDTPPIEKRPVP